MVWTVTCTYQRNITPSLCSPIMMIIRPKTSEKDRVWEISIAPPSSISQAQVLYSEAVSHDLFPSLYQRSIFNQPDLRTNPWWTLPDTGYLPHLQPIIDNFANITRWAGLEIP